jgi:MerR family transcriptional regulator, heat shock protein HspR
MAEQASSGSSRPRAVSSGGDPQTPGTARSGPVVSSRAASSGGDPQTPGTARSGPVVSSRAVYIISVAAELAGVHPQTLRTYERRGLIKPARTSGGTRRYSARDVERVRLIQELTQGDGINLAGVLRILALEDQLEQMEARLDRARDEVRAVQAEARQALRDIQQASRHEIVLYRAPEIERHAGRRRR